MWVQRNSAPSPLRATRDPCSWPLLHLLIPHPHATRREEGRGSVGKVAERDNRGVQDAKEQRQHQAPFPQKGFPYPQPLLLRSHDLCHRHNPAFSCKNFIIFSPARMLPSSSWPSPPPFLSESHRQERDQLDKNLNQCKCEIQRKKKKSLLILLNMLQTLCLVIVATSSTKET